jgi:hypothetical protein
MKLKITMLCIFAATISSIAQDKNFDLSKYKLPDYKRHLLEFNLNSSGHSSHLDQIDPTATGDSTIPYSNSSTNSRFNFDYQYDRLTRKHIDYIYSRFSGEYSTNSLKTDDEFRKNNIPEANWYIDASRKTYLKEDQFFLEGLAKLNYSFTKSYLDQVNQEPTTNIYNSLNVSIGFGAGLGRQEKVSDFWQVYYILENLKKQNALSRDFDENDVNDVAQLASILKNKRFFDARLRKIAELSSLDSLLRQKKLLETADMAYFTTLNDYWTYGNFPVRVSGRELKLWLAPEFDFYTSKKDNDEMDYSDNIRLSTNISFRCTKQINLFWERRMNINFSNYTRIDTTDTKYSNEPNNQLIANANLGFGFFPDSRTSLSADMGYSGMNSLIDYNPEEAESEWINGINFNLSAYYYISPRIQINGHFGISYWDKQYNVIKPFYMNYNIGLRYAIF